MLYRTIVADPPWDYGRDHNRWPAGSALAKGTRLSIPFSPMSVEEIRRLPIVALAESDCRLFLWTTNRYLPTSFEILQAWGFRYRQTLIWHKTNGASPWGGSVAPNHAEFLLVAAIGAPRVTGRLLSSVIDAPRQTAAHSKKPETFLDLIEQVSPGPYLELFARRNRLGWDTWGDEALNHVDLNVESAS